MNSKALKIHIAVACHKPSYLLNNAFLVPVQVNSSRAKNRMAMAHDDEGDNISLKNPEYCELTAQYWEWKNVEADYYGLCHYRRFLCFKVPENVHFNERDQIEAEKIDSCNIARFALEDEALMREIIEANDVVTGMNQNISRLPTPRGNQITAYKHWTAHDRALIMTEDLKKMLDILDRISPEIGRDTREYLNSGVFSGFNCFVMKKSLFQALCQIEFAVLEELERCVDISNYCTQLSRIYGFMGEIISSGYIYHLEKRGFKVKHVPLVYFNNTDTEPERDSDYNAIPVLFYQQIKKPELFTVTWKSFLETKNPIQEYEAIICHIGMSTAEQKMLTDMAKKAGNTTVRFLDAYSVKNSLFEHYGDLLACLPKKYEEKSFFPLAPFFPYILKQYTEILLITGNPLIEESLDSLWNTEMKAGYTLAAPLNAYMLAQINDIYPQTKYNYLLRQLRNPYNYHSLSAAKINLAACREKRSVQDLVRYCINTEKRLRNDEEIINAAFEGMIQTIELRWCVWYDSNPFLSYILPYAPKEVYQELVKARQRPAVVAYMEDDPYMPFSDLTESFWRVARRTPVYEHCLAQFTEVQLKGAHSPKNITKVILRKSPKVATALRHVFPKNSLRYRMAKGILSRFNFS